MELKTYARVLLRRWWLPVAGALLAAGVAYGVAARATPVYRATAQLSVLPSIVDFFTGEAVQRLLNNYSLQLRSRAFALLVAEELGRPGGADQAQGVQGVRGGVEGKIKAVAAPAEYRIAIEVDDADPGRARDIANAAALAFVEKLRAESAGRDKRDIEVQVLDLAEMPGAPISPRPRRDALGAAVLGAAVGVGAAFLVEYFAYHRPAGGAATRGGTGALRRRRQRRSQDGQPRNGQGQPDARVASLVAVE